MTDNGASSNLYKMKISLNVLTHLGINLYSSIPAVISEVVANAWDADAELVEIDTSADGGRIEVRDNGHGMTRDEVNSRYLNVGYQRRESQPKKTDRFGRDVMGRKGIGKLSIFSIAEEVEVHTARDGEKSAFRMSLPEIQKAVRLSEESPYQPTAIEPDVDSGTRIVLTKIRKKSTAASEKALKIRLARRFTAIDPAYNFAVRVNGNEVTPGDRAYWDKLQYVWNYGDSHHPPSTALTGCEKTNNRGLFEIEYDDDGRAAKGQMTGWVATVKSSGYLKDTDNLRENLNKVTVMVRKKVAIENLLDAMNLTGLFTKWLIGEVHADFLDQDDLTDITTSNRQNVFEEDPRYAGLLEAVHKDLRKIESEWLALRKAKGRENADEIVALKQWLEALPRGRREKANKLLDKVHLLLVDDQASWLEMVKNSVLAFESLALKDSLDALDTLPEGDVEMFLKAFNSIDDIEAALYHKIASERLAVVGKLMTLVGGAALERVVQQHVFDHLWLLDPSWERAASSEIMEQSIDTEFKSVDARLTDDEKKGRVDIRYRTSAGKHIIIELKKPDVKTSTYDLMRQVDKYRSALNKVLVKLGRANEPIESVCLVGLALSDWSDETGREESRQVLATKGIRVMTYQQILDSTQKAYQAYIDQQKHAGRILTLISEIESLAPISKPASTSS